jgi:hypothetical protein
MMSWGLTGHFDANRSHPSEQPHWRRWRWRRGRLSEHQSARSAN